MAIVNNNNLRVPVLQSFEHKLLATPTPKYIHRLPARHDLMDRHSGTIKRFRRYEKLDPSIIPIGNTGEPISPDVLNVTDIDARVDWYGQGLAINEQVVLTHQDAVLNAATERLAQSMRESEDIIVRNMLASTATVINATGGTNGDSPTELTRSDINEVVRVLRGSDAQTLLDTVGAEDKFGTAPVRDSYFALAHTDLIGTLDAVDGFTPTSQYPNNRNIRSAEYGSISNIRYMLSTLGSTIAAGSANGATTYNTFVVGQEAYGVVDQDGAYAQLIYRDPMYSDMLAQNSTLAWKTAFATVIFNDEWVVNHRSTLA